MSVTIAISAPDTNSTVIGLSFGPALEYTFPLLYLGHGKVRESFIERLRPLAVGISLEYYYFSTTTRTARLSGANTVTIGSPTRPNQRALTNPSPL